MIERISIFIIIIIIYFVGCSPSIRHNVLTTIFDGVPELDTIQVTISVDTISLIDDAQTTLAALEGDIAKPKPTHIIHPPYLEKNCENCHDKSRMGAFVQQQPGLCFQCHENTNEKHTFSHGPAEVGYCTSCHSPHKSELENLLVRPNQQLCLHCHDLNVVSKNEIHLEIGETSCTDCHSPHSSNNQFLLREGTCAKCHDDFNTSSSHIHGPVEAGLCTSCHSPHMSKSEKLLVSTSEQLCLNCHDRDKIDKNNIHTSIKGNNCTECHNPHSSSHQFMLLDGVCTKCHEDFNESYSYIHGVVALQDTNEHHEPSGKQSCFDCHDSESIYSIEPHISYKETNCTRCHNI